MNTDKIVRAENNLPELLRIIAYPSVYRRDLEAAADLIESLQAQLAESQRRERAAVRSLCGACGALTRATGHGWEDSCYKCQWWRGVKEERE